MDCINPDSTKKNVTIIGKPLKRKSSVNNGIVYHGVIRNGVLTNQRAAVTLLITYIVSPVVVILLMVQTKFNIVTYMSSFHLSRGLCGTRINKRQVY